jgi:DNA helicase II / ATP-dependent DNA helicase PcrA
LSTIHRAKGLENERVFIIDYDKLPMYHLEQKEWEKVQEINLKYVAVTRAMKELFLVVTPTLEQLEQEGSLFDELPFN